MSVTKQLLKEIPRTEFHPDWTKSTNYKEKQKGNYAKKENMGLILTGSKKLLTTAYGFAYISYNECYPNRMQCVENREKISSTSIGKVVHALCRFFRNPQLLG